MPKISGIFRRKPLVEQMREADRIDELEKIDSVCSEADSCIQQYAANTEILRALKPPVVREV